MPDMVDTQSAQVGGHTTCNIASHLPAMARRLPDKRAVVIPSGRDPDGRVSWSHLTFSQLNRESDRYARGLEAIGIVRGTRTVLMVTPSLDFFALVFALFKVGAVLVLIDPGLDRRQVLKCLEEVEPEAFVGVPPAHLARLLFPAPFKRVKACVTVGRRWFWGGHTHVQLKQLGGNDPYVMAETRPEEVAAILFTSGSTGIPKGAIYTHGIFDAQVRLLKATYDIREDEIDLATFPLFALFDPALGATAIIPDMDARKPGSADPVKLLEAIYDQGVTQIFGSPALLDRLSRYGEAHNTRLPSVRRVLSSGAPVTPAILRRTTAMLCGNAQLFTPYGATESLPVCNIGSQMLLEETVQRTAAGEGICVGKPVQEMTVRIIRITDDPISHWSESLLVPQGEIGEITVRGPVVTAGYYARPEQTAASKIQEGAAIVHRMGDVGWLDAQGRLWMCGRKNHRVETEAGTLFSVPVEEPFNQLKGIRRTALVWVGARPRQRPVLCVEAEATSNQPEMLLDACRALAAATPSLQQIKDFLLYPKSFPVDIRHNAKISREKLAEWAGEQLR